MDKGNANCSDGGSGTAAQPFCTIRPAASSVVAGPDRARRLGDVQRDASRCRARGLGRARSTSSLRPGPRVTSPARPAAPPTASPCPARSYITVQGFTVTGTSGDGIVVKNSSQHHDPRQSRELGRAARPGQAGEGDPARQRRPTPSSRPTPSTTTPTTASTSSSSTRIRSWRQPCLRERPRLRARGLGDPALQLDRQTRSRRTSRTTTRTPGSSRTRAPTTTCRQQRRRTATAITASTTTASTGQRIIANSVYKNVTAGINIEGSSTGGTIANNIAVDNGIESPRTHSNIRVDSASTSGTTLDYDLVYLSSPDLMLIWNSVTTPRSRRSGPRPGRRCTASRPIRSGRAVRGRFPPDRRLARRSTPPTRARAASRLPTRTATPASTIRRPRTPAPGPARTTTGAPTSSTAASSTTS